MPPTVIRPGLGASSRGPRCKLMVRVSNLPLYTPNSRRRRQALLVYDSHIKSSTIEHGGGRFPGRPYIRWYIIIIIKRRSGINPIPPTVKDRD